MTYLKSEGRFLFMKSVFATVITPLFAASCASTDVSSIPLADNSSATALFEDVNRYRDRLGKPPLIRHPGLDVMARQHSEFMMRHGKSPNHIGFSTRAATARAKYNLTSFHENTATGPHGTSLTRIWAASPSHAPSMKARWDYTGVGVVTGKDGYLYATQLFGTAGLQTGR
jgi:uncharacterized protein YkwD